ncbi:MAG: DNA repair protein RecO [Gammaproteobacteria bacterium]
MEAPSNTHGRTVLEQAYVLHYRPYRDSSLIVEILTAAQGRIALVARGARRPRSRMHGLLQPFRPLLASWTLRGEMGSLTAVEVRDSSGLSGRMLISGFYLNELLMRLLHRHDPHPGLFANYEAALRRLASPEIAAEAEQSVLRLFEATLLRELGYGLVLDHEIMAGAPILPDAMYYYYPERGPVREDAVTMHHTVRDEAGEYVAHARPVHLHGGSLLALARGELHDAVHLHEAKRLLRTALEARLGGKPLASRKLFRRRRAGRGAEAETELTMEGGGRA